LASVPAPGAVGCYRSGKVNVTLCLAKTRNVVIVINRNFTGHESAIHGEQGRQEMNSLARSTTKWFTITGTRNTFRNCD